MMRSKIRGNRTIIGTVSACLSLGIFAAVATVSPATAAGTDAVCANDGTEALVQDNMYRVTDGSDLNHDAPVNLVANGDFTDGFTAGDEIFWGASTVRRALDWAVDYPNGVLAPIDSWTASGGGPDTYARWWDREYSRYFASHPTNLPPTTPASDVSAPYLYFGNWSVYTTTTADGVFGATGDSTATSPESTFTQHKPKLNQTDYADMSSYDADYGPILDPAKISQTVTLIPGHTYRLSFLQDGEPGQTAGLDGLAGLDISGFDRTYFRVYTEGQRYLYEFTAAQAATTISFMNWGHLENSSTSTQSAEISLDDVIINHCVFTEPATALASTGLSLRNSWFAAMGAGTLISAGLLMVALRRRYAS